MASILLITNHLTNELIQILVWMCRWMLCPYANGSVEKME